MGETPELKHVIKELTDAGVAIPPRIRSVDGLIGYLRAILKNLGYKEGRLENELNIVKQQIKTIKQTLNKLEGGE